LPLSSRVIGLSGVTEVLADTTGELKENGLCWIGKQRRNPPFETATETRSLLDLGNRSENSAGRGQILSILQGNSCSFDQKSGGIWTAQTDLQQIYPKADRLLGKRLHCQLRW